MAIVAFPFAIREYMLGRESLSWPFVEGKIETRKLEVQDGRGGKRYRLTLSYRYTVAGNSYLSTRIRIGLDEFRGTPGTGEAEIYPLGTACKVYYRPEEPNMAVLEPGLPFEFFTLIIAGVFTPVLIAIAIGKARGEFRWLEEKRRSEKLSEEFNIRPAQNK